MNKSDQILNLIEAFKEFDKVSQNWLSQLPEDIRVMFEDNVLVNAQTILCKTLAELLVQDDVLFEDIMDYLNDYHEESFQNDKAFVMYIKEKFKLS